MTVRLRNGVACATLAFAALSVALPGRARADDGNDNATQTPSLPFERRGLRRGGIALFTAGVSALPSSLALYLTTDRRMAVEAAGMAAVGHALMAAGIPMWAIGAQGRPTRPRNAAMMYAGMLVAGVGFAALPPSSALFVASFDQGAPGGTRTASYVAGAAANGLLVIGIPLWAIGAASPDDAWAVGPGGASLRVHF